VSERPEFRVVNNEAAHRYEAFIGDERAGFVDYRLRPGRIVLVHTEVDDSFEGQGVGGRLAEAALDDARARGLSVSPMCPFIASFIDEHPEYADLVVPGT
jgi:predicted GNAT family acetyltransferase